MFVVLQHPGGTEKRHVNKQRAAQQVNADQPLMKDVSKYDFDRDHQHNGDQDTPRQYAAGQKYSVKNPG